MAHYSGALFDGIAVTVLDEEHELYYKMATCVWEMGSHFIFLVYGYVGDSKPTNRRHHMKECKLCHKSIPNRTKIGNRTIYTHKRTYCLDCSPSDGRKRRLLARERATKFCSGCETDKPLSAYWKRNRGLGEHDVHHFCKDCSHDRQHDLRNKAKQSYVDYKGGKCEKCGYSKCIAALDFHHEDPTKKEMAISVFRWKPLDKVKSELDKCKLLCSNCHRELHYLKGMPS